MEILKEIMIGLLKVIFGLVFTLVIGGGFGVVVLLSLKSMGFELSLLLIVIVMVISLCMGSSLVRGCINDVSSK